ncbi:nitrite reductase small subunit NirD [Thermus scotoductus]|uniref:Nitrite reductase (NAD(P)H) small subunit n=1 Tax=Thermus scotoductus TaxID=37636 RepID=A0A430R705_THESC|nr:nitrite reductase small subunit NirD [Thermus scotoductus]RTG91741.1 nitrite reductase (NAD(P)H) small subunit [Thermus scotoductus]RTH03196.1 nitrite reductase (NAD(P)H) small subunit [Thermus scotoductus]RTH22085.1 nitrite reductase (NAD(P)H) small subunit [Thermus scotoductus]RTI00580.1 nitrite reductase (NAD(P)H) small subunit [Thermus scotoductus]RTI23117.1 nitrite reductase (NAD(P)H) small subunit [Thermus scotoductus]
MRWVRVCRLEDILPGSGVCALVEGKQVAIFRVGERLFALSNFDPFTKANVISRGLVGSKGERLYVASPLLKHRFNLETGEYLDDPTVRLAVYPVRLEAGEVWVGVPVAEVAKVGT